MAGGAQILKATGSNKHHAEYVDFPVQGNSPSRMSPTRDDRSPRLPSVHLGGGKSATTTKSGHNMASPLGLRDYRDLRVGLPRIQNSGSTRSDDERRRRLPTRSKSFVTSRRTLAPEEEMTTFNPDPVPYHSGIFKDPLRHVRVLGSSLSAKEQDDLDLENDTRSRPHHVKRSSTMTKNFPQQPRNSTMWRSESDGTLNKAKGYILHTGRYQWGDLYENSDEFTQRGRLQIEREYIERLKLLRRRREMLPHREAMEFMMGGCKVELNERDDVMQEIKKLKGIILPTAAKDLYVGRGFSKTLPKSHALNKPKSNAKAKSVLSSMLPPQDRKENTPPTANHVFPTETQEPSDQPQQQAELTDPQNTDDLDPNTQQPMDSEDLQVSGDSPQTAPSGDHDENPDNHVTGS